jgi:hypothetical protein
MRVVLGVVNELWGREEGAEEVRKERSKETRGTKRRITPAAPLANVFSLVLKSRKMVIADAQAQRDNGVSNLLQHPMFQRKMANLSSQNR